MTSTSKAMDSFFQFKDFVALHLGDLTSVLLVVFVSSLALLFASREIVTWLARTRQIRADLNRLHQQIESLKSEILKLQLKQTVAPQVQALAPKIENLDVQAPEKEEFPLEARQPQAGPVFKIF